MADENVDKQAIADKLLAMNDAEQTPVEQPSAPDLAPTAPAVEPAPPALISATPPTVEEQLGAQAVQQAQSPEAIQNAVEAQKKSATEAEIGQKAQELLHPGGRAEALGLTPEISPVEARLQARKQVLDDMEKERLAAEEAKSAPNPLEAAKEENYKKAIANGQTVPADEVPESVKKQQVAQKAAASVEDHAIQTAADTAKSNINMQAEAARQVGAKHAVNQATKAAVADDAQKQQQALDKAQADLQDRSRTGAATLQEWNQDATFGQKVGFGVSMLLGGIGQGLLGLQSNPAMDVLNRSFEQEANKRKLTLEQKKDVYNALLDRVHSQLQQHAQNTTDLHVKAQIQNMADEMAMKKLEYTRNLLNDEYNKGLMRSVSSGGVPDAVVGMLPEKLQGSMVRTENGLNYNARSPENAREIQKFDTPAVAAIGSIDRLKQLTSQLSELQKLNPAKAATDPLVQEINQEVVKLKGSARNFYVGSGRNVPELFKEFSESIRNPADVRNLSGASTTALEHMKESIQSDRQAKYKQYGIDLPSSREQQVLQNTPPELREAMRRTLQKHK